MSNNAVPVFVTANPRNNIVPVVVVVSGGVPIAVFADPALSFNNCVPIRLANPGEQAVPVVIISGSIGGGDGLQFVEGGDIGFVEGGVMDFAQA